MAFMVLTAQYLSLGGTALADYCNKAELTVEVDEKDVTTYGSLGWKVVIGGLKSGSLAVEYKNDYAAAALDSILWGMFGTVVPFEVRATQAAVGAANPKYTGSCLIKEYKPIQGGVGDEASTSATYPTSGAVARATS